MSRHQWTKDDIRKVFKTCQDNVDKKGFTELDIDNLLHN